MNNESFQDFQYDSCISRGICSLNPRNSALQTVLVLYLRIFAKYVIEIDSLDKIPNNIKEFILNTISITIYNSEFNENSFLFAIKNFKIVIPKIMDIFSLLHPQKNLKEEKNKLTELLNATSDVIQAIKFGEKHLNLVQEKVSTEIRDLYNTMLVIAKSLSINLIELESFDKQYEASFLMVIKLLSNINIEEQNVEFLKILIQEASEIDYLTMKFLREAQEERYSAQYAKEVSYTTTPGKAVLVVGSNIRELENVLEAFKQEDVDIYTHDDMMLAHTFPKFSEYKHLKGQFGQGLESCLLDFATFPGPIILTKNSLHNIENFYRGLLFTTDYTTSPKGIIKIFNNNFSEVIESAKKSRGFKTGKQCETVVVGFNYSETMSDIKNKLESDDFEEIIVIGSDGYSLEQKSYFEKLIRQASKNSLIISFSYSSEKENVISINTCFDYFSIIKIVKALQTFEKPIKIFFPKCERSTISQMIYLSKEKNLKIFVGKCTPIILNPTLMKTLKSTFNICEITTVKKDLNI